MQPAEPRLENTENAALENRTIENEHADVGSAERGACKQSERVLVRQAERHVSRCGLGRDGCLCTSEAPAADFSASVSCSRCFLRRQCASWNLDGDANHLSEDVDHQQLQANSLDVQWRRVASLRAQFDHFLIFVKFIVEFSHSLPSTRVTSIYVLEKLLAATSSHSPHPTNRAGTKSTSTRPNRSRSFATRSSLSPRSRPSTSSLRALAAASCATTRCCPRWACRTISA
jgi:hypothetical protein